MKSADLLRIASDPTDRLVCSIITPRREQGQIAGTCYAVVENGKRWAVVECHFDRSMIGEPEGFQPRRVVRSVDSYRTALELAEG